MCHAHRFVRIAQCVLDDDFVAALAQNNADARTVISMPKLFINRRKVKIHLAGKLRFKVLNFQIDNHVTTEPDMVEKQVQIEILIADLQVVLTPEKCKPLSQFQNEVPD